MRVGLALLVLLAARTRAERYWVSASDGDDGRPCSEVAGERDPGRYRRSPTGGLACLTVSGDRLTLKAGEYSGPTAALAHAASLPSGTAEQPLLIEGEGSEGCAVRRDCPTKLLTAQAGPSYIDSVNHVVLRRLEIDCGTARRTTPCLEISGPATNVTLEDLDLHHTLSHGLLTRANVQNLIVRRVNVHHNGNLDGGPGCPPKGCDFAGAYLQSSPELIEESVLRQWASGLDCGRTACVSLRPSDAFVDGQRCDHSEESLLPQLRFDV